MEAHGKSGKASYMPKRNQPSNDLGQGLSMADRGSCKGIDPEMNLDSSTQASGRKAPVPGYSELGGDENREAARRPTPHPMWRAGAAGLGNVHFILRKMLSPW